LTGEARPDEITTLRQRTIQDLRSETIDARDDLTLAGFRDLHSVVGGSNRKHVSSPENLVALVLSGRDLPTINAIVDTYNIVSLQSRLALGAHELSKLEGPIVLRLTNGTENFTPLGSAERKAIGVGEYGYVDEGCNEVICRLETRQCEKTKVSASSCDCFFIVEGNSNTDARYIQEAPRSYKASS
jgi:DNA/RNA-binding domain of Phe-tRNA-synthetase-like protein